MPFPAASQDIRVSAVASFAARAAEARRFRLARGQLCSEKMGCHVGWTSPSQRDAMILLELRHNVRSYTAWPLGVDVFVGGEPVRYHPSLGATLADGSRAVIDIVRADEWGTPERQAFAKLLGSALVQLGLEPIMMRESAVVKDGTLPNAREVMRAIGRPVPPSAEFSLQGLLAAGPVSLGELRPLSPDGHVLRDAACLLAMRRKLSIDLRAPTMDRCLVSLPAREAA